MLKDVLKKDQEIAVICLSLPGVCDQGMIDLCDFEDFQNKNILEILKKDLINHLTHVHSMVRIN